jgi:hypothetical protein
MVEDYWGAGVRAALLEATSGRWEEDSASPRAIKRKRGCTIEERCSCG